MPSVIAGISDEVDELLDRMVERNEAESREKAARKLIEWAAYNKYNVE